MTRAIEAPDAYTKDALIAEGFTDRTIRYYVEIGVLPRAHGRGRSAWYGIEHIAILREIKRAWDNQRSLSDIREHSQKRYRHAFAAQKRETA